VLEGKKNLMVLDVGAAKLRNRVYLLEKDTVFAP
jgi:hypothetical protein